MAMFQKSCLAFDHNQDVAACQFPLIMNLELQKTKSVIYSFRAMSTADVLLKSTFPAASQ